MKREAFMNILLRREERMSCNCHARKRWFLVVIGAVKEHSMTPAELKTFMADLGVSKTIYALVTPETEAAKNAVFDGGNALEKEIERTIVAGGSLLDAKGVINAVHRARAQYFGQFREAWTEKQNGLDKEFFDTWFDWVAPIAPVDKAAFSYHYPTAGASEGLREAVHEYGSRARHKGFVPEIFVFNGEYEGYQSYADASYIATRKYNRRDWNAMVDAMAVASQDKPVQLYLSQPSGIDGNVWPEYDAFMKELAIRAPNVEVILDLTYAGCIARDAHIATDYPNIKAVTFSLSKPMGGYYDRVGGFIAKPTAEDKDPYPGLYGNMWFKNLTSIAIGTQFMQSHGVHEIPRKYKAVQERAIAQIAKEATARGDADTTFLTQLKPADVFMLATCPMPEHSSPQASYLGRLDESGTPQVRACLTPLMAEMIGTAKSRHNEPTQQR